MKFTKEMQDRIIKWVELNGLYPQPCGSTLQSLCDACGISWDSFKKWEKKPDFSERLSRARAKFAATVEVSIVNSLVRSAQGAETKHIKEKARAETIEITHPDGTKEKRLGELKTVEAFRDVYTSPGDVKAAQFLLTNIAPDRWKLKQEHTLEATGVNIEMSLPQEAIDGLQHAIDTGAQPRQPKEEE